MTKTNKPYRMNIDTKKRETAEKVERWLTENGYTNITKFEACGIGTGGVFYVINFDCPDLTADEMAALDYPEYVQRQRQIIKAIKAGIKNS